MAVIVEMVLMILLDLLFIAILVGLTVPLFFYKHAAFAVLKRNFVGYFSNPTGYVFLCIFVLGTSFFAFCLPEFFTSNLANFDQLNQYILLIMLVFIPAITMSIWAEEQRQGTDELLLTLPAADFDIVIGKYLAAVSIFTVSLIFSQLCNFGVLAILSGGNLDIGLLFTTYFGYWLIGITMLSVGMVASFLTNNLTVGFVLGVLFNIPLVLMSWTDAAIPYAGLARFIERWSLAEQFDNFGRGVINIAALTYFVMIVVVCMYISMVLIGRRHWMGGRDSGTMLLHFLARAVSLLLIALFANLVVENTLLDRVFRWDTTRNDISSLHPETVSLIRNLDKDRPKIVVDAYIGDVIPPDYVKTRNQLVSWLKDFQAKSGGRIQVNINEGISPFSEKANEAEQRFGIKPERVHIQHRGAFRDENVILGAAFTCGLERVVVPFFEYGIPVEYELVRSINTVSKGKRKTIGVLDTDAQMMGGFSMAGGMPHSTPKQAIIDELEKQYDIERVDANSSILSEKFDAEDAKYAALLVVQPSSLTPPQLGSLLEAIRNGQPTAIFEDPYPAMISCPGTSEPKQNPGGMFGQRGPPPQKCDMKQLWGLLKIETSGSQSFQGPHVVYQRYNPYRKVQVENFGPELVFVSPAAPGAEDPFNPENKITSGLDEVLFPMPGAIKPAKDEENKLKFTRLVETGFAGTIDYQELREKARDPAELALAFGAGLEHFTLAARITTKDDKKSDDKKSDDEKGKEKSGDERNGDNDDTANINVIYVADIDLLSSGLVQIRARPDSQVSWKFENVTFVLNVVDTLTAEDEYVTIRKRKPEYSTLRVIENKIKLAQDEEFDKREDFKKKYTEAEKKAEEENKELIKKFQDKLKEIDPENFAEARDMMEIVNEQKVSGDRKLAVTRTTLREKRDKQIEVVRRRKEQQIENIQTFYRVVAVVLPPIPPIIIGIVVLVWRLLREREGISKERLR